MKASRFFGFISLFAVLTLFTACGGGGTSVYWDPWYETEGYVVSTTSERTDTMNFVKFVEGEHPEDQTIAVRHEHSYTMRPRCTFEVKKLTTDVENNIVDEFVTDDQYTRNFTITNKPYTGIKGFIFYCDEDTVYVINDMYILHYKDADNNSKKKAQYLFEIKVNGIQALKLYMNFDTASIPKPTY